MQATFQTKIRDERVYALLDAMAALFGRLMRRLFVELHVRGRRLNECKKLYIARYGLTARQFNAPPEPQRDPVCVWAGGCRGRA